MMRTRGERAASLISAGHVGAVVAFLYVPLVILVMHGFTAGKYALRLEGFSTEWYARAAANPQTWRAIGGSFSIAFVAGTLATALGTGLAVAVHGARGRLRTILVGAGGLPLLVPEIVLGLGLLVFLSRFLRPWLSGHGVAFGSYPSVAAGHVTLALGYVMLTVRARLAHFDPAQVAAALDLGATPWQAFRYVTLPQILPGVASGFLLAVGVSLDDFYVSYFVSVGGSGFQTLPLYFWSLQGRQALTPEINVVSTLLLACSGLLVLAGYVVQRAFRTTEPGRAP